MHLKCFFVEDNDIIISHNLYHSSSWPGDSRIQYTSKSDIDLVILKYFSLSAEIFKYYNIVTFLFLNPYEMGRNMVNAYMKIQ